MKAPDRIRALRLNAPTALFSALATAGLAALAMPALAQDAQALALATQRVEITATMPLQSVGTPLRNIPANVQTGDGQQIHDQGAISLDEFLDRTLGSINSSNSLGNPFQLDISYRGFTASPVLGTAIGLSVFVDGVRINEAFGDVVDWDMIPANAISSVHLAPGSNPLFGLNTLGGAVVVATKNGADDPGFEASVLAGSFGRRTASAELGLSDVASGTDLFMAGNLFHENGYRDNSHSDVRQLFAKARWHDASSNAELSLSLADDKLFGAAVLPVSMLDAPTRSYTAPDDNQNRNAMLAVKAAHAFDRATLVEGNLYVRTSNIFGGNANASCDDSVSAPENCVAKQASGDLDTTNVLSTTDQRTVGGALQLSLSGALAGHENHFTMGVSLDAAHVAYDSNTYGANLVGEYLVTLDPSGDDAIDTTGSNPYFQGATHLTSRSNTVGVYASDSFALDPRWNLTVAGRFNHATVNLAGATVDETGTPVGSLDGDHTYNRLNPAIGLNWNPSDDVTVYAGANQGMRVPSPVELSCANPLVPCALPTGFASDPDLKMIVSRTFELGARGKLSPGLGWSVAAYDTENRNDIQFIASGADNGVTGYFQNVGRTRRRGVEIGLDGRFDRVTLGLHYGLVDATYQTPFVEASPENANADADGNIVVNKGDRIPGIARQTLKVSLAGDVTSRWRVGATVVATSGQYAHGDENNSNPKLRGYGVLNLQSHYRIGSNWTLFAKADNVLNRKYDTFGILGQNMYTAHSELAVTPSAPRAGWLGVTYAFGRDGSATADAD